MKDALYLLTGAAGFLGSNISRALISQGKRVRALVLPGDPAVTQIPPEAELVTGDILDENSLEEFFRPEGKSEIIVIHCASMVTVSPEYNQRVYEVNVLGTKNIIALCLRHRVKKLVYVSSTGAIPEPPRDQVITEADSFDPALVVGFYGQTKAIATRLVLDAVHDTGLDASIVFPSGITGPNDYAYGYFSKFIIDYVNGSMPAGIAGSFNSVDVRDLALGVIACSEKGRKGEGYIMSNGFVSMRDLFRLISDATGVPEAKLILPVPLARILAFLSSLQSRFTQKPALLTSFAVYNLARNNNFSSEKAQRELGYTTRPFEETMADSVSWLASQGKIHIEVPMDTREERIELLKEASA